MRPTADRVRETLFNWLARSIAGARCLDLFAGTGALGIEALSRGASRVTFVEPVLRVRRMLAENLASLGALPDAQWTVRALPAQRFLAGPAEPYDIVFLDPPFGRGLLAPVCTQLDVGGWLAPGARVYLEFEGGDEDLILPAGWCVLRRGTAGQARFVLAGGDCGHSP